MDGEGLKGQLTGDIASADAPTAAEEQRRFAAMVNAERKTGSNTEDDTIMGGGGADIISGLGGGDRLVGGGGNDTVIGGAGDDRIFGNGGNDRLIGSVGDDRLVGGGGKDTVIGGGGSDNVVGGGGKDSLKGGGGDDTIKGGGGKDTIKGGGGADLLDGQGGSDLILGGGGADTLIGGKGNDTLAGGGGADTYQFNQRDLDTSPLTTIRGFQSGLDFVDLRSTNAAAQFEDLDFDQTAAGVVLTIGASQILFESLAEGNLDAFDFRLPGSQGGDDNGDPFTGGPGPDAISSGPGDDLIRGLGGDDKLGAGAGEDTLVGGAGADIYVIRLVNGGIDPTVDFVQDFDYVGGDRVGLTEVLSGIAFSDLTEVVRATPTGGDTVIAVKRAATFQDALILQNVTFTTADLVSYGFTAPPKNSTVFQENPYGFDNRSVGSAGPQATSDGNYVVWVDQQNLDGDPLDFTLDANTNRNDENLATRDIFILNTQTGALQRVTERTTADRDGFTSNVEASSPAISANGRIVAYVQEAVGTGSASGLSRGNVFIRDMSNPDSAPVRVDISASGALSAPGTPIDNDQRGGIDGNRGNNSLPVVDISGDGNRVVFVSNQQLDSRDTNGPNGDVYLRDIAAGTTTLISQLNGASTGTTNAVKISEDGRYIAFASSAAYTSDDLSSDIDIFLFDTATGNTLLVSSPAGGQASSFDMSADGSRIIFTTEEAVSSNDVNGLRDVYVATIDLGSFTVTSRQRVSEAEAKFEVYDGDSYAPTISPNGDRVAFFTAAQDMVNFRTDLFNDGNAQEEFLVLVDLETGVVSIPDNRAASDGRESGTTNLAFTDDTFFYREFTDAAFGNRTVTDVISNGEPVPSSSFADVPGTPASSFSSGQNLEIQRGDVIRSTIDSASDVDVFLLKGRSDRPEITVEVLGVDGNAGTLADPSVRVVNSSGVTQGFNDNFNGRSAQTSFNTNGDRFIIVESADGSVGSYRLHLDRSSDFETTASLPTDDFIF